MVNGIEKFKHPEDEWDDLSVGCRTIKKGHWIHKDFENCRECGREIKGWFFGIFNIKCICKKCPHSENFIVKSVRKAEFGPKNLNKYPIYPDII